ncbi:MAG: 4-hydroxythreonine-4-phosphate dehydrogenase PdxA [Alphaproteobacteria bacterium]|nr:4-hydroxythreonine-4-phosphate dehydrogenase PdxA [Alphaproteobacteria bacterium]
MGDPAGIGGEIALMAWTRRDGATPPFAMLDDPARLEAIARRIGLAVPVAPITEVSDVARVFPRGLPVLPVSLAAAVEPGRPDPRNAPAVIEAIDRAIDLARTGKIAAMVTNPINKAVLYAAGFRHPGHTEYLADRAGLRTAPVMMLASPALRVVPVTIHLALREAVGALTTASIIHCGRVTAAALMRDFAIPLPVIAVAGLNPHAGEDGHLGREEIEIVAPAVAQLRAEGIAAHGPAPADTLFHARARAGYDAVLCMYHDQALIPLKTIDFDSGVNVTLGLPFVRTSPDHGTAYDIAGTGRANPASLIAAIALASTLGAHRLAAPALA